MNYLKATYYFDFENESIQALISEINIPSFTVKQKVVEAYKRVRDEWRYDPYSISLAKESYRSSIIARKETGNCVEKSILLISCLRGMGVPSRIHLGKVKNHIAVDRLTEKFGSNELTPHGMVSAYIEGKWLKMSPAFNASLCKKLNVEPLEFDGEQHSFLQQFNSEGTKFMEYLDDYGYYEDVPLEFMVHNLKEHYPQIFARNEQIMEYRL